MDRGGRRVLGRVGGMGRNGGREGWVGEGGMGR